MSTEADDQNGLVTTCGSNGDREFLYVPMNSYPLYCINCRRLLIEKVGLGSSLTMMCPRCKAKITITSNPLEQIPHKIMLENIPKNVDK